MCFCKRFFPKFDRTIDQMVQAARSGKQNIIEGSMASATSKETEIKLTNFAGASLEELLEDYFDYLRVHKAEILGEDSKQALYIRNLAYKPDESYETHSEFIETRSGEIVANIMLCLIHQCNYLPNQQIRGLEQDFIKQGGLRERMSIVRIESRKNNRSQGRSVRQVI